MGGGLKGESEAEDMDWCRVGGSSSAAVVHTLDSCMSSSTALHLALCDVLSPVRAAVTSNLAFLMAVLHDGKCRRKKA